MKFTWNLLITQEEIDLDVSVDRGLQKLIDTAGAGASVTSPGWLTQLGRLWGGKSVRLLDLLHASDGMHASPSTQFGIQAYGAFA